MQGLVSVPNIEETMKLSIEAELVYNFAHETQVIANLEASRTSDQIILSESLDIQPPDANPLRHHPLRRPTDTGFALGRCDHPVHRGS